MDNEPTEIESDGRRVWVNQHGYSVARFGPRGFEVLSKDAEPGIDAARFWPMATVDAKAWDVWRSHVKRERGIWVPDRFRPPMLAG